jgi:hypothetical protein
MYLADNKKSAIVALFLCVESNTHKNLLLKNIFN